MTKENNEKKDDNSKVYHHIDCHVLKGLKFSLDDFGRKHKDRYSILALSSKETIKTAMRAVDKSPFKTIFVVDEKTGVVGFAISQNEEYVTYAKKRCRKKPASPPPPPPPPKSYACRKCEARGGTCSGTFSDGSVFCIGGSSGGITSDWNDPLEVLMP